ncbi:hypothetical protein CSKR_108896 [Clonorchis sinensis]|uniref:Uncharacterized protein n=1 Tax=Clonorchis sinensis TaxID=79923 RepID=A0A419PDL5_CLOSI|nr:hypothetical protein CSKR_108896 [Clonorchis sinensis]
MISLRHYRPFFGTIASKRTYTSSCPLNIGVCRLAFILNLLDVPKRFDGLCVSSSHWIHKVSGMINRFMSIIHVDHRFTSLV